jgi:hypothetical protein
VRGVAASARWRPLIAVTLQGVARHPTLRRMTARDRASLHARGTGT